MLLFLVLWLLLAPPYLPCLSPSQLPSPSLCGRTGPARKEWCVSPSLCCAVLFCAVLCCTVVYLHLTPCLPALPSFSRALVAPSVWLCSTTAVVLWACAVRWLVGYLT